MRKTVCKRLKAALDGFPKIKIGSREIVRFIRLAPGSKKTWEVVEYTQPLFCNHYRNAKKAYSGNIEQAIKEAKCKAAMCG